MALLGLSTAWLGPSTALLGRSMVCPWIFFRNMFQKDWKSQPSCLIILIFNPPNIACRVNHTRVQNINSPFPLILWYPLNHLEPLFAAHFPSFSQYVPENRNRSILGKTYIPVRPQTHRGVQSRNHKNTAWPTNSYETTHLQKENHVLILDGGSRSASSTNFIWRSCADCQRKKITGPREEQGLRHGTWQISNENVSGSGVHMVVQAWQGRYPTTG